MPSGSGHIRDEDPLDINRHTSWVLSGLVAIDPSKSLVAVAIVGVADIPAVISLSLSVSVARDVAVIDVILDIQAVVAVESNELGTRVTREE